MTGIWLEWVLPTIKASRLVRKLTPWWLLEWVMQRNPKACRANVVMWKLYDSDGWGSWNVSGSCWDGPGEGWDYCGKWQDYETFKRETGCESYRSYQKLMTPTEQEEQA